MNSHQRQIEREQLRARLNILVDEVDMVVQGLINNYRSDGLINEEAAIEQAPETVELQNVTIGPHPPAQQNEEWEIGPHMSLQNHHEHQGWEVLPYQPPLMQHWETAANIDQQQWNADENAIWLGNADAISLPPPPQHPWETPRSHFGQDAQRGPDFAELAPMEPENAEAQPANVVSAAVHGALTFAERCLLCLGRHSIECNVTVRGNGCLCVAICTECTENGFWEQYVTAFKAQCQQAVEENEDPYTGLPRQDQISLDNWVQAHDQRPRCLNCQTARVDFLLSVVRPRRSNRARVSRGPCAFC
ncbi:hypothetical protein niasHS_011451 [Heterodera schachtii]|uniref:Uncharacterized protein n=1 Tax=Heterodera schachtii TaxID=97005 RepID=A0ABD2III4_HETSC